VVTMGAGARKVEAGEVERWLGAERYVECDDAEVRRQAGMLKGEDGAATVQRVYRFVRGTLQRANYEGEPRGARWALKNGRGDRTEHAFLVAALCRAAGGPARVVGGWVMGRDGVVGPEACHDWVEAAVDGRWRVVDAHRRVCMTNEGEYVVFRVAGAGMLGWQRLRCSGVGVTASMDRAVRR